MANVTLPSLLLDYAVIGDSWPTVAEWWHWLLTESTYSLYGGVPLLCSIFGYLVTATILEWVIMQPWAAKYFVQWGKEDRQTKIDEYRTSIAPKYAQMRGALWVLCGPGGMFNVLLAGQLMPLVLRRPTTMLPVSVGQFVLESFLLHFVDDFFLYWGHRLQHENQWLWDNCHSFHHAVRTPTPYSAIYIDATDATLQGGLPLLFSQIVVQAHPLTAFLYFARRVSENVVNHTGLEGLWLLDVLSLKVLPGRAPASHHDAHHHFCNYSKNAKNYGEATWFWDWLFGTLSPRHPKKKAV